MGELPVSPRDVSRSLDSKYVRMNLNEPHTRDLVFVEACSFLAESCAACGKFLAFVILCSLLIEQPRLLLIRKRNINCHYVHVLCGIQFFYSLSCIVVCNVVGAVARWLASWMATFS